MANIALTYELSTDGNYYIVTGTEGNGDTVVIPNAYEGKPVKEIKNEAFKNKTNIVNVTISHGVTDIGSSAFYGCTSLTEVTIPTGVTNVKVQAFESCYKLIIYCEAQSKPISWNILWNPLGRPVVWDYKNNDVANDGYVYVVVDGLRYGVKNDTAKVAGQSSTITAANIPATIEYGGKTYSVTSIDKYAFRKCTLSTSVTIPDTVISIGTGAFFDCTSLTSVTIPDGVTSIGNSAFGYCTGLLFVVIPKNVTDFGTTIFNQCNSSAKFYFQYNDTTKDLKIGGGTKLYYNIIKMPYNEMDFLGFTFNGKHSYLDLGVIRIINDRIQTQLSPDISDLTAESTGGDGIYFFGSYHKSRKFTVDFAFDGLTETQLRNWKKFCSYKDLSDLIFDEEPYKVYTAKIASAPMLKALAFEENGQRIYKGEGSLEFICYWPYAHTPCSNTKVSSNFISDGKFFGDGKNLSLYFDSVYPTKSQWSLASGLTDNFIVGSNSGDMPAPFIFKAPSDLKAVNDDALTFAVGNLAITVPAKTCTTAPSGVNSYTHHYNIEWNSKTGMVSATENSDPNSRRFPILYTGNSLGAIPVGGVGQNWGLRTGTSSSYTYTQTDYSLEYDYWYY